MNATKQRILNLSWALGLSSASIAFLLLAEKLVPGRQALVVNFVLMPMMLGCIGSVVFRGALVEKILLLALLPMLQIVYFGSDDGKPGLENVIALGEFLVACGSATCTHFFLSRGKRGRLG